MSDFSEADLREAMLELIPMKMGSLNIPVTKENVDAIKFEKKDHFIHGTAITVTCHGMTLFTPDEIKAIRTHLETEYRWEHRQIEAEGLLQTVKVRVPQKGSKTPLIDALLYGAEPAADPFEGQYADDEPLATKPPRKPKTKKAPFPVLTGNEEVKVTLKKPKRRLG